MSLRKIHGEATQQVAADGRGATTNIMRILIVSGLFPNRVQPYRGIFIQRQAVELSRRADVRVIAPVAYVPSFLALSRYSAYSKVPPHDTMEGIEVDYPRYYIIPKILRHLHGRFLERSIKKQFERTVREYRPDVVIGFFAYPYGYAAVRLAKQLGLPVITGVLGSDINLTSKHGKRGQMVRRTLEESDRVFSVCGALGEAAVKMGAVRERLVVIPNGVDKTRFQRISRVDARERLQISDDGKIVVCVSNLTRVKGVDIVIRGFAGAIEPGATLLVIGEGEDRAQIEQLVSDLGMSKRIRLMGSKPPDEIPLWLAAADVVALGSRAEGHPNIVLEGLASGRPVVATRVGGVPETITSDEFGIIVEPENPVAFGDGLRRALATDWNDELIRTRGLGRDWGDVADEITKEIEILLNETSGKDSDNTPSGGSKG